MHILKIKSAGGGRRKLPKAGHGRIIDPAELSPDQRLAILTAAGEPLRARQKRPEPDLNTLMPAEVAAAYYQLWNDLMWKLRCAYADVVRSEYGAVVHQARLLIEYDAWLRQPARTASTKGEQDKVSLAVSQARQIVAWEDEQLPRIYRFCDAVIAQVLVSLDLTAAGKQERRAVRERFNAATTAILSYVDPVLVKVEGQTVGRSILEVFATNKVFLGLPQTFRKNPALIYVDGPDERPSEARDWSMSAAVGEGLLVPLHLDSAQNWQKS